ncbi:putative amino acid transporter [Hortaea werneckii]|nr:putative amino acid transporter [Hortaea werneckii]
MRDQPRENSEHGDNPSRLPIMREGDRDSTDIPCSSTSPQTPGAKKTAEDDVLAVIPTNRSHAASTHGDVESGTQHKEEPDSASPRNPSHAEGTVIETQAQETVHYATMSWWHTALVMIAETISLGILSLPSALATLRYIPGILLLLTLGLLSWYTGTIIYEIKIRHFGTIHSYADIFALWLGKRAGRWFGEVVTNLMLVFIVAAHIVTFSVMMNVLTEGREEGRGMCSTNVFMGVGATVFLGVSLPRTFRANSWASTGSCLSILLATFTALVSIAATPPHPLPPDYAIPPTNLAQTTLAQRTLSLSSLILAYNGQIAYPSLLTEMHHPQRDFPKALRVLILTTTGLYVLIATLIYHFAGSEVASPALGSAPPLGRKIAYGLAIPTIVVAGVIPALVASKQTYRHVWRRRPEVMAEKSWRGRGSWYAVLLGVYVLAWLIGEAIPVFRQLLGVIGAGFGTWFALGFPAVFALGLGLEGAGILR